MVSDSSYGRSDKYMLKRCYSLSVMRMAYCTQGSFAHVQIVKYIGHYCIVFHNSAQYLSYPFTRISMRCMYQFWGIAASFVLRGTLARLVKTL